MLFFFDIVVDLFLFSSMVLFFYFLWIATPVTISGCSVNTSHTSLKKAMTNSDHRTYKNTAYIRINMLYFYILYKRGHYFIIETLDSHFSWAMTTDKVKEYSQARSSSLSMRHRKARHISNGLSTRNSMNLFAFSAPSFSVRPLVLIL